MGNFWSKKAIAIEDLPTVPMIRSYPHPMCEGRDLYMIIVECPYCEKEHNHGPLYCKNGQVDHKLDELHGPSRANCFKGEYMIDISNAQTLVDAAPGGW